MTEGKRLAVVVGLLALSSGVAGIGAAWLTRHVQVARSVRRGVDVGLAAGVVGAVVVAFVVVGGPRDAWAELEERFESPLTVRGYDLNERLFAVSGTGRAEQLRVAWDAALERPIVGQGAGSYEYLWYTQRPSIQIVRDAHSLYAETFAELGLVGLTLLALALLVPLLAALRARRQRAVPAAAAAYLAWVVHSAMDWHWEIVGVTLTAILAGGVVLVAAERRRATVLPPWAGPPLLIVTVALTVFALVSLVGNQALFAGREAVARGEWDTAREHARRADALLPWSFEPSVVLGDAAAGRGDRREALARYRDAAAQDPANWVVWLRVAQVARGRERATAYATVHALNPRETKLPGESR